MSQQITIYHSDVDRLLTYYVQPKSIDCAIFSPPYYRLRNYKVDGQIGWEETPELYVRRMKEVIYKLWEALKDDGTIWMIVGDSYSQGGRGKWMGFSSGMGEPLPPLKTPKGYRPKNLLGIPWRLALALQGFSTVSCKEIWDYRNKLLDARIEKNWDKVMEIEDWLCEQALMVEVERPLFNRTDIIWSKENSTPEGTVKDRPTRSHEYIFLFSKNKKYFFNQELLKSFYSYEANHSVWKFNTDNYKGHYATYPVHLIHRCIIASCPEGGTVLDPFCGSGTTGLGVLQVNGNRNAILGDIKLSYCKMSYNRIKLENPLFGKVELIK